MVSGRSGTIPVALGFFYLCLPPTSILFRNELLQIPEKEGYKGKSDFEYIVGYNRQCKIAQATILIFRG